MKQTNFKAAPRPGKVRSKKYLERQETVQKSHLAPGKLFVAVLGWIFFLLVFVSSLLIVVFFAWLLPPVAQSLIPVITLALADLVVAAVSVWGWRKKALLWIPWAAFAGTALITGLITYLIIWLYS